MSAMPKDSDNSSYANIMTFALYYHPHKITVITTFSAFNAWKVESNSDS